MKKLTSFLFIALFSLKMTNIVCREKPKPYIEKAIEIFKKNNGSILIELGTMLPCYHDLDTVECNECMSGHSTLLWGRALTEAEIYSVDINAKAIEVTKQLCQKYKNVYPIVDDGIEFLRKFSKPIDLLFLDAWDVNPGTPYAEKHLEAYEAAKDKLTEHAIILIDDTDIFEGGKGRLIIPQALKDGFKLVFTGRQTLLVK